MPKTVEGRTAEGRRQATPLQAIVAAKRPKGFLQTRQGNEGRPTGRPYRAHIQLPLVGTTCGASMTTMVFPRRCKIRRAGMETYPYRREIPCSDFNKKRQKTHRSRNKIALRCGYRRTVDEINFDCGAFLGEIFTFCRDDPWGVPIVFTGPSWTPRGASLQGA